MNYRRINYILHALYIVGACSSCNFEVVNVVSHLCNAFGNNMCKSRKHTQREIINTKKFSERVHCVLTFVSNAAIDFHFATIHYTCTIQKKKKKPYFTPPAHTHIITTIIIQMCSGCFLTCKFR